MNEKEESSRTNRHQFVLDGDTFIRISRQDRDILTLEFECSYSTASDPKTQHQCLVQIGMPGREKTCRFLREALSRLESEK